MTVKNPLLGSDKCEYTQRLISVYIYSSFQLFHKFIFI